MTGQVDPVPVPEIDVADGGNNVADAGSVAFGTLSQGATGISKTFVVRNTGTENLTLQAASFTSGSGFTITTNLTNGQVLAPNATADLIVRLDSATLAFVGTVVSETLGANAGLGYLIALEGASFRMANVYAALLLAELVELPVDLAAVTRAVVRDFVPRSMERRIDLGYEGPEPGTGGTRLVAEPVLLSEMVRNLVDNALRYTPPGGTVTARIVADALGQAVSLQVEDSGPGIPAAEREAVFALWHAVFPTGCAGVQKYS